MSGVRVSQRSLTLTAELSDWETNKTTDGEERLTDPITQIIL